jgi:hypothetical protein
LCDGVEIKTKCITAPGSYKEGKPYTLHGEYSDTPRVPHFMLPKPIISAPYTFVSTKKINRTLEQCIAQSKRKHAGEALHDIVLWAATNAAYNGFSRAEILNAMRQDAELSKHTQLESTVKSVKAGGAA